MKPRLAVVGGGIAGMSCGAYAANDFDVTVMEAELQPGYHSSGRSAAVYIEPLANGVVHALTLASADFFRAQGAQPVDDINVSDAGHAEALDDYLAQWRELCPDLHEVDPAEVLARVPILRPEQVHRAALDPNALKLDAHGLLDGYRRRLVEAGGRIANNARVDRIVRENGHWTLGFGDRSVEADVIVNAAGAWGDQVAAMAGVAALGLAPLRRTALLLDVPHDIAQWPLIHRAQGGLYFKPEGGQLMVSLADESPSSACDAQPDEFDLAVLVDRFQELTDVEVRRLGQTWAGLRTFLPDRVPAAGYDDAIDDFFWLVGQGGSGMQTAPALGQAAADLLAGRPNRFARELSPARRFT